VKNRPRLADAKHLAITQGANPDLPACFRIALAISQIKASIATPSPPGDLLLRRKLEVLALATQESVIAHCIHALLGRVALC
jgi:hypothetical protein